jgi:hypothetical protein
MFRERYDRDRMVLIRGDQNRYMQGRWRACMHGFELTIMTDSQKMQPKRARSLSDLGGRSEAPTYCCRSRFFLGPTAS